jgi:hypothetical protein
VGDGTHSPVACEIGEDYVSLILRVDTLPGFVRDRLRGSCRRSYRINRHKYEQLVQRLCKSHTSDADACAWRVWVLLHRYQALFGPSGLCSSLLLFVATMLCRPVDSSHLCVQHSNYWGYCSYFLRPLLTTIAATVYAKYRQSLCKASSCSYGLKHTWPLLNTEFSRTSNNSIVTLFVLFWWPPVCLTAGAKFYVSGMKCAEGSCTSYSSQ